jgi:integrase
VRSSPVRQDERGFYPLFLCLARTGMRLGEALALQWDDVDFQRREARIARARAEDGSITTPKSGHGRTVDLSGQLVAELRQQQSQRKSEKLRRGLTELPPWTFCTSAGTPYDHANVLKAFKRVLKAAKLPGHYSPHGLRHTYASLLLQAGESPAYVQRHLGHASIQLTVDTYGKWLPLGNKAAVDALDSAGSDDALATASARS